jgi:hypothetical protein
VNDVHCHFLSNRFFEALGHEKVKGTRPVSASEVATELAMEAPGSAESLADRWIAELDRHHVSRAALIGSIPGDEESVAVAVRRHPARLVGFFALNAAAPDAVDRARRAYGELSLRCACLFPAMHRYGLDDERTVRVLEVADAHGGAVFAHCGLSVDRNARALRAERILGFPARRPAGACHRGGRVPAGDRDHSALWRRVLP